MGIKRYGTFYRRPSSRPSGYQNIRQLLCYIQDNMLAAYGRASWVSRRALRSVILHKVAFEPGSESSSRVASIPSHDSYLDSCMALQSPPA